ncbi:hypothetical protein AB0C10_21360 [Microbispora amethystogenes]|uniref:hypothetical protein n=1 Tax=Microbispora amethystogenes TaxID=1427754 RepID=UPI0033DFB3FF
MNARLEAIRLREQAEMLEACADVQEHLAAAKGAASDDPSPDTIAAKRQAMADTHEFRRWVRAVRRIRKVRALLTELPADDKKRPAYEAELADLEARYGQFTADLETLKGTPGSVTVEPEPVRLKSRIKRPGGA